MLPLASNQLFSEKKHTKGTFPFVDKKKLPKLQVFFFFYDEKAT
jgi:hypothetical protein